MLATLAMAIALGTGLSGADRFDESTDDKEVQWVNADGLEFQSRR